MHLSTLASGLLLVLPWPLLALGILSGPFSKRYSRFMKFSATLSAAFALACAILATAAYMMGSVRSLSYLSLPLPWSLGELEVRVGVNTLSLAMALLVAFVGFAVARYSVRYMDGEEREGEFYRLLSLTLGFFFTMVVVDNFWAFFLSWVAKGFSLHRLLLFYPERPKARLAAWKKFFLHRIADAALLGAFVLLARTLYVDRFSTLAQSLSGYSGPLIAPLSWAAALIIATVILKSAQFPLQGWLIQVMEAPTPVSALMHAGLIYSGTFLFLRTFPLVSHSIAGRNVLIINGLATVVVASLAMMIATDIKGSLAWSTSAQMGFMLLECGLGLPSVAVMHTIAHSVYKAHAFLSSGSVVIPFRGPDLALAPKKGGTPARILLALATGFLLTLASGYLLDAGLIQNPALFLMGLILSVALSRLLLSGLSARGRKGLPLLLPTAALVAAVSVATFALHRFFENILGGLLPSSPLPRTPEELTLLGIVALVFLSLLAIEESLPSAGRRPFFRYLYVHMGNGFYFDLLLDRMAEGAMSSGKNEPGSNAKEVFP